MAYRSNRRKFLQTTTALGVGYWVAGGVQAQESKSPNEKIGIAASGYGLKGEKISGTPPSSATWWPSARPTSNGWQCAAKAFPKAKQYTDYRKMYDEMDKSIDAVVVGTPDHSHTVMSVKAMKMGKHCFCQKPLTRTIWEARLMADVAREKKVSTQMGNQGTALSTLRQAAALLRAKVLGKVSEVHVWTDRPNWPFEQGKEKPKAEPVPAWLDWDQWIGPAPMRPYANCYHPMSWRGFWDFGTGALGDMACHTVNMPYMGLDLKNPTSVVATTSGHNKDSFPKWSMITFEFPANDWREALTFHWYDGGKCPPEELLEGKRMEAKGCIVVGEKGKLFAHEDYCNSYDFIGKVDVTEPRSKSTECPDPFRGMDQGDQGRPGGHVEFPQLRRRTGRDHPAGQPGRVDRRQGPRQEDRVGRQEPQGHQRPPRSRSSSSPPIARPTPCSPPIERLRQQRDISGRGRSDCPRPVRFSGVHP